MNNTHTTTLRSVVITTATFLLFSVTNAQVLSWSEDFSSEPADWVASGTTDSAGSGVSYDAANGRYDISAAGGGTGAPTFGLNGAGTANATGSPVDSYVAEITFDLINFKGGAGGADLTFTTTGTDGRMEVKLNPFGRFNLSHTDFANGASGWTINNNFGIVEMGGSILNNGDAFTIKMDYDGDADSMSFFYGVNGDADTLIYTATAATDSAGGYGFGDTITGTRWDANKKEAMNLKLYQWGSGDPASIGLTSASVTFAAVPEPSVYALLAGLLALATVMIRRRS